MKLSDLAKLSTRMFKTNPARTWLTVLGMGVGTGAVVTLVGFGFGLQGIILEKIVFGETLLSLNVSAPTSGAISLTDKSIKDISNIPNVKDVAPMASFPTLVTYEGLTGNIFLQGVTSAYLRYAGTGTTAGALLNDEDEKKGNQIMLSPSVLKLFGVTDPKKVIGKTVTFRILVPIEGTQEVQEIALEKKYVIKGITNDQAAISALIPFSELTKYVKITRYDRVQVRVTKSEFLDATQKTLIQKGFTVTALSKTVEQATKIFQGIQAVLALFGGIALIVSAIGMFNTMTVTLLERTNEIGIMRTIGASPSDIRTLFLSEATIVGFLGGVVGILIGAGIGLTLNAAMNAAASKFGGASVSLFRYPFLFLLFILMFSGIVGFCTGIFPAKRASSLNPLDAIRYK